MPCGEMQFPELVTDFSLGPAGDLPADAPAARTETLAYRADVPVLGQAPIDEVLTQPAAPACGRSHKAEPTPLAPCLAPRLSYPRV